MIDDNINSSIICGFIAGIFSSIFLWIFKPKPHIKICKQIAYKTIDNTDSKSKEYRIKIINKSIYNAYEFKVNIRILCNGCYLNLNGADVIILKNRFYNSLKNKQIVGGEITYERTLLIDVFDASNNAMHNLITTLNDKDIINKYEEKKLTLHDLKNKDANLQIEVILVATNAASGVKRCFFKRLDSNFIEGVWELGKSKVTPKEPPIITP